MHPRPRRTAGSATTPGWGTSRSAATPPASPTAVMLKARARPSAPTRRPTSPPPEPSSVIIVIVSTGRGLVELVRSVPVVTIIRALSVFVSIPVASVVPGRSVTSQFRKVPVKTSVVVLVLVVVLLLGAVVVFVVSPLITLVSVVRTTIVASHFTVCFPRPVLIILQTASITCHSD